MALEIVLRHPAAGIAVLAINGEVDMGSASQLRDQLTPIIASGAGVVVVDLSKVSYMDSSGIATLVEGLQSSMKRGITFRLSDLNSAVLDVFKLARLDSVFKVYDTTEAAVADQP